MAAERPTAQPMSDYDKCLILYKKMHAYGPMSSACRKWRHKTEADKTWANCVDHFIESEVDNSADATAANLGFSNATVTEALTETRELLANLSTSNNEHTDTILDLRAQIAAANVSLQYVFVTKTEAAEDEDVIEGA